MPMKMRSLLSISMLTLLLTAGSAFAGDAAEQRDSAALSDPQTGEGRETRPQAEGESRMAGESIPATLDSEHWAYREVAELLREYGAEQSLPVGRPCSKGELADCLLAVLNKLSEKYQQDGSRAIRRDDLETIHALRTALEHELAGLAGYRLRKETIEEVLILVEPEEVPFSHKFGMKGFLRGEGADDFSLSEVSYTPDHGQGHLVYRAQPYIYWHMTDYLGFHLEGQGYGFTGGGADYHRFSFYQGFVEGKLPGRDWVDLKAGRQEFNYGSGFLLGADSFYDGLSFDAVRLRVKPLDDLSVDLLGGRYASHFSGGLRGNLAGAYLTYAPSEQGALEVYGFRDTGSLKREAGEHLDSWGFRSTFALGPLALEIEPVYQSGKLFNPDTGLNDSISAYGGHIDLAGKAELGGFTNTLFLSYTVGSGSGAASREFSHANNETPLVGDIGVLDLSGVDVGDHHASGLNIYTLGWGIDLTEELNFSATGRKFVARSVEAGFSRQLGLETDLTLTYNPNKDLSLILGYDRFFTGRFFRDASGSGRDIDYGYAMVVFNWDKTRRKR